MIFLQILKMIGLILLILLLIVIGLLLLILFYPLSYRVKGIWKKEYQMEGSVTWLFHLIGYYFYLADGEQEQYLRILWFRKKFHESEDAAETVEDTEDTLEEFITEDGLGDRAKDAGTRKNDTGPREHGTGNSQAALIEQKPENGPKTYDDMQENPGKSKETAKHKKPSIFQKMKNTIAGFLQNIKRVARNLVRQYRKWDKIFHNKVYQAAAGRLKKEFICLLKHIVPSRMWLNARFSTGAPDTTGIALGVIAMFPVAYQNRWNIVPDFEAEQMYVDAEFDLKGHVFVFQILASAIRVIFDQNCRKLYHAFRT